METNPDDHQSQTTVQNLQKPISINNQSSSSQLQKPVVDIPTDVKVALLKNYDADPMIPSDDEEENWNHNNFDIAHFENNDLYNDNLEYQYGPAPQNYSNNYFYQPNYNEPSYFYQLTYPNGPIIPTDSETKKILIIGGIKVITETHLIFKKLLAILHNDLTQTVQNQWMNKLILILSQFLEIQIICFF